MGAGRDGSSGNCDEQLCTAVAKRANWLLDVSGEDVAILAFS